MYPIMQLWGEVFEVSYHRKISALAVPMYLHICGNTGFCGTLFFFTRRRCADICLMDTSNWCAWMHMGHSEAMRASLRNWLWNTSVPHQAKQEPQSSLWDWTSTWFHYYAPKIGNSIPGYLWIDQEGHLDEDSKCGVWEWTLIMSSKLLSWWWTRSKMCSFKALLVETSTHSGEQ